MHNFRLWYFRFYLCASHSSHQLICMIFSTGSLHWNLHIFRLDQILFSKTPISRTGSWVTFRQVSSAGCLTHLCVHPSWQEWRRYLRESDLEISSYCLMIVDIIKNTQTTPRSRDLLLMLIVPCSYLVHLAVRGNLTKLQTHTNNRQTRSVPSFKFYILRYQMRRQSILKWMKVLLFVSS
jgi:hypothetical protein